MYLFRYTWMYSGKAFWILILLWLSFIYIMHYIVCSLLLLKVHRSCIFLREKLYRKKKSSFFQGTRKKLDLKLQVQVWSSSASTGSSQVKLKFSLTWNFKSSLNIFNLFGHSSSRGVSFQSQDSKIYKIQSTLPCRGVGKGNQLTLFKLEGVADYASHTTTSSPQFKKLFTPLPWVQM